MTVMNAFTLPRKKVLALPVGLLFVLLVLLSGCKNPEDPDQPAQTKPIIQRGPEIGPDASGDVPVSEEEYEKFPKYIVDPKAGRVSADAVILDMPPVDWQGQGNENSCSAWAAGYAVRSYLYHKETKTSYSLPSGFRDDKTVFSPRFIYNSVLQRLGPPLDNGISVPEALNLMMFTGVSTWADMPYIAGQFAHPVYPAQTHAAGNYKIKVWNTLPMNDNLEDNIKMFLKYRSIPVILSMIPDDGFKHPKGNIGNGYEMIGKEFVWKSYGKKTLPPDIKENSPIMGHAVVVFGYDDTKHAFKIMNSYGNGWAYEGCIWMDYDLIKTRKFINGQTRRVVRGAYMAIGSTAGLIPVQSTKPESWTLQVKCSTSSDEYAITFKEVKLPTGEGDIKFKLILDKGKDFTEKGSYMTILEGVYNSNTRFLKAELKEDHEIPFYIDKFEITLPSNNEYSDWVNVASTYVYPVPEITPRCKLRVRFRRE
jgi:hypothetical protein